VSDDLHSHTSAGPEPTSLAGGAYATAEPGGNGVPLPGPLANLPVDEHPEILVGAAFAGGLVAAFVLKRLRR
jgi:hypothetical protein